MDTLLDVAYPHDKPALESFPKVNPGIARNAIAPLGDNLPGANAAGEGAPSIIAAGGRPDITHPSASSNGKIVPMLSSGIAGADVQDESSGSSRPNTVQSSMSINLLRSVGLNFIAKEGTDSKIAPAIEEVNELDDAEDSHNHRELKFDEEKEALAALHSHNLRHAKGKKQGLLSLSTKPSNAVAPITDAAGAERAISPTSGNRRVVKNRNSKRGVALEEHGGELKAFHDSKQRKHTIGETELRIVDESVPRFVRLTSGETFFHKVLLEIRDNHRWFSIYWHYDPNKPRAIRWLGLMSSVFVSVFTASFLYGITNEDNGFCEAQLSEELCLKESSVFDSSTTKCHWYTVNKFGQCGYSQPKDNIVIKLYVTLAVALVAAPMLVFIEYIIVSYIEPPTIGSEKDANAAMHKVATAPTTGGDAFVGSQTPTDFQASSQGTNDTVMVTSTGETMQRLKLGDGFRNDDAQWYDTPRDLQAAASPTGTRPAQPVSPARNVSEANSGSLTSNQEGSHVSGSSWFPIFRGGDNAGINAVRPAPNVTTAIVPATPGGAGSHNDSVAKGTSKADKGDKKADQALIDLQVKTMLEPLNKDIHKYRRTLYACDIKDLEDFDAAWGLDYKGDISNHADTSIMAILHRASDSLVDRGTKCIKSNQNAQRPRPKY